MEDIDLTKLPKRVRFKIEKLEADLKYYNQKLAQVEGKDETDTFWGHGFISDKRPLPKGETIYFYIGKEYLGVRVDGDHIDLNATIGIKILPRAANNAWVELK